MYQVEHEESRASATAISYAITWNFGLCCAGIGTIDDSLYTFRGLSYK